MLFELPKIAIVGYGRAGKDTAGAFLGKTTSLRYNGSTSNVVRDLIAKDLGISPEQAWNERHTKREFWKTWCNNYRKEDPTKIIRACLEHADIVIGIRGAEELYAAQVAGFVQLTVWIENPRVPVDPTVDFTKQDCDVIVLNDSGYVSFFRRLINLARFAGLRR